MKCWRCREKIPDNARFCPFCQANLSQPDRGQIMRRIKRSIGKKAVPIVLGVALIGGAAVGGIAIFSGDSDKKPEKNKTEASDVKKNDNTSSEADEKKPDVSAESDVISQAEKALADYIAETITYDECAALLKGLKSDDDQASADAVTSKLGMADLIKNSRSEFAKAEKAVADGQFSDAILAYQKVISDDPKYYQLAQDKIKETADLYKDSLNSDAEAKVKDKDFRGAVDAMSAAQYIFANDANFVSACEDRKTKIYALWIAYEAQIGNFFDNDGAALLALEQNAVTSLDADSIIAMGIATEKSKYIDAVNAKRGSQMQAVDSIMKIADSKAELLMASDDDGLSFDVSDELEAVFPAWMEWKASKIKGYPNAEQAVASLDASSGEFNPDFGYIGVGLAFDKESKTLTWYVLTVSDKE